MRTFITMLILLGGYCISAQPWMYELSKKKSAGKINFYDIQKAFEEYWKNKEIEKGKGYKPFKRWEYFMEPRVSTSGKLPYSIIREELLKLLNQSVTASVVEANWQFIGPDSVPKDINSDMGGGAGRINCIAFHPVDSNIIWVGAPSGGVWKTTDGGKTWSTTTDALASIGISDIVVNSKNPNILYLATGDGDAIDTYGIGILKSTDGGQTWQPTALQDNITDYDFFRRLLIHPQNPDTMIAASNNGIYKTTDGWDTYTLTQSGHFKDIEFHPTNPSVIYAASYDYGGDAKIYRSTNTGSSFSESMSGLSISGEVNRIELAVSANGPSVVYALCSDASDDGFYGLYKSSNSGVSWTEVYDNSEKNLLGWSPSGTDNGGQGYYDLALAVSPSDTNEVYVGGVNIWKSENGGTSWDIAGVWYITSVAEYVHADQHTLVFNPHNQALFSGNDGGIYKTYNKGETWTDLSDGLEILQIYKISNSDSNPELLLMGNQDNGTIMLDSGSWNEVIGGDGMECYVDYDNNDILYGTLYYGDIRKSTNRGLSFASIMPDESLDGAWVTPVVMHPNISSILYIGYQSVYRTINGGYSWTELTDFNSESNDLIGLAIAPSNDNIMYASTRTNLYKTTDGGTIWDNITDGLPSISITSFAVAETNPDKIWVTFSGYSSNSKVYYSDDGGDTWTNYSFGLPNLPVNCITYQKNSQDGIYVGTDIGIYYRNASMSQWENFNQGLPNVIVYDLEINYSTDKIRAGTHGRGVWESDLYHDEDAVYTDFITGSSYACVNGTIDFYDNSEGTFDSLVWNFGSGANPAVAKGTGPHEVYYTNTGEKIISLTGYVGTTPYINTKTGILSVVNEIDFEVTPDIVSKCSGAPTILYATGNFDFTWSPSTGLNTSTGYKVLANPSTDITYTVTAQSGSCTTEKNIVVLVMTNDAICDAIELTEGLNGPFSNYCATIEEDEPVPPAGSSNADACQSQDGWCDGEDRIDNSVWFKFDAPASGVVSIETDGFDNQIAVYQSSSCSDILIGNYTLLAANDDYPGKADYSASIEEIDGLVPGNTYWMQLDGSYGGVTGNFTVTLNYSALTHNKELEVQPGSLFVDIFPNPNDGGFTLEYSLNTVSNVSIQVYNMAGNCIFFEKIQPVSLSGKKWIDLASYPAGLYIVELKNQDTTVRKKFSIHEK